jgi:hypothetical protein
MQEEIWNVSLPKRLIADGCVISSSHKSMNMDLTAAHEVGHCFGLHHPQEAGEIRNGVGKPGLYWSSNPASPASTPIVSRPEIPTLLIWDRVGHLANVLPYGASAETLWLG